MRASRPNDKVIHISFSNSSKRWKQRQGVRMEKTDKHGRVVRGEIARASEKRKAINAFHSVEHARCLIDRRVPRYARPRTCLVLYYIWEYMYEERGSEYRDEHPSRLLFASAGIPLQWSRFASNSRSCTTISSSAESTGTKLSLLCYAHLPIENTAHFWCVSW
jgi:hypothetical protein